MPEDQVDPGEVVLGTLENPVARNMYSLWKEMFDGSQKFTSSIPENLSPFDEKRKDEVRRLKCQMHQYGNRINCAKSFFWELVYSDFPAARDPGVIVGVRKDWVVVIFKSQRTSFLDLFGGGGDGPSDSD